METRTALIHTPIPCQSNKQRQPQPRFLLLHKTSLEVTSRSTFARGPLPLILRRYNGGSREPALAPRSILRNQAPSILSNLAHAMASYTSQRGPNGTISPSYPHQLPAPGHAHSSYSSSQALPSMAPSANGSSYGAHNYPQSQPYQHSQPSYQSQQSQPPPPPPHQQAYQQPPPPGPPQHALPSPTPNAQPQSSSGPAQTAVGKLEPVSTIVGGRRFSYVTSWTALCVYPIITAPSRICSVSRCRTRGSPVS